MSFDEGQKRREEDLSEVLPSWDVEDLILHIEHLIESTVEPTYTLSMMTLGELRSRLHQVPAPRLADHEGNVIPGHELVHHLRCPTCTKLYVSDAGDACPEC